MRYYEKRSSKPLAFAGALNIGSVYIATSTFNAVKRATPAMSLTVIGTLNFPATNPTTTTATLTGIEIEHTANATNYGYFQYDYTADARL
jgi:hypothetical protein